MTESQSYRQGGDGLKLWCCDVTGNPVGTDTVMIGSPECNCQGHRAARLFATPDAAEGADRVRVWDENRGAYFLQDARPKSDPSPFVQKLNEIVADAGAGVSKPAPDAVRDTIRKAMNHLSRSGFTLRDNEAFEYLTNAVTAASALAAPVPQADGADPLVGLDERLDRLCLGAKDGSRFILSTESAQNIVGIVREWIRAKAASPKPVLDAMLDALKTLSNMLSFPGDERIANWCNSIKLDLESVAAPVPLAEGALKCSCGPICQDLGKAGGCRERMATAILEADIAHPKGLKDDRRSLGYYASVGIDQFSHPHDTLGKLALAAADAILALPVQPGEGGRVIEESENTNGHRMLTVSSDHGAEFIIDADAAAVALANLFSSLDNEYKQGWTLNVGWYAQEIKRLRTLASRQAPHSSREGGR